MAESLQLELNSIDETLKGYEADIAKLQASCARPAPARMRSRRGSKARYPRRASEIIHGNRTEDAFSRFEQLERRADFAEGPGRRAGDDRA